MPRGRKPTATAIKEANGAFVKNPQRKNHDEPKAAQGRPPVPESVKADPVAMAKWEQACEVLEHLGVLTVADADQLEMFCLNESLLVRCWEELNAMGVENEKGSTRPATHQWNKCMDRRLKIMAELGLTTSSRTRLKVAPKDEVDPFLEYINSIKKN